MPMIIRMTDQRPDPYSDVFIDLTVKQQDYLKKKRRQAAERQERARQAQAQQYRREAALAVVAVIATILAVVGWGTIALTPWS